jgi:subtilisin family serine protease
MSFEDILPGSIEKRSAGSWITPEEAAAAIRDGDGSGVRIAVLDSGVEIGHPDFRGRQLDDDLVMDTQLGEFAEGDGQDLYGHGTAVAGIIWNVAPEAGITSFRVLGPNLSGRTAQVWLAANEAITRGFDIVNCSFACGISGHLSLYKDWTDRALLKGVHVVAASHGDAPEWPAHFASVIAVDCAESTADEGEISYSAGRMVEFSAAIDGDVAWKDGSHRSMTGSSFAAALMTGIVARLLSVYRTRDPLLLKALLQRVYGGEEDWN